MKELLFLFFALLTTGARSQPVPADFHSMELVYGPTGTLSYSGDAERLQLTRTGMHLAALEKRPGFGKQLGNAMLSTITGIGIGSDQQTLWQSRTLLSGAGFPVTAIDLYFRGVNSTDYSRERSRSGFESTVTESSSIFHDGSFSILSMDDDTLAVLFIRTMPQAHDSLPAAVNELIRQRKRTKSWRGFNQPFEAFWVGTGTWRGRPVTVALNDEDNLAQWYEDGQLKAVIRYPGKVLRRAEPVLKAAPVYRDWTSYPDRGVPFVSPDEKWMQGPDPLKKSITSAIWLPSGETGGAEWLLRSAWIWTITNGVIRMV